MGHFLLIYYTTVQMITLWLCGGGETAVSYLLSTGPGEREWKIYYLCVHKVIMMGHWLQTIAEMSLLPFLGQPCVCNHLASPGWDGILLWGKHYSLRSCTDNTRHNLHLDYGFVVKLNWHYYITCKMNSEVLLIRYIVTNYSHYFRIFVLEIFMPVPIFFTHIRNYTYFLIKFCKEL